ncbi:hypothetical protein [Taklimakanibacter albus]|uniref:Uncharacterized protein n=1 Tax=Taklimakanibacter albus TaxID=2800327 RepID=A0ACC5R6E6_9HYPH|nr:hypothetical protein [Aestuariivirga sp. YIM B02566]MBK1868241.1 hypothetical protein [Aestuariivirga sp. YIM B02566]
MSQPNWEKLYPGRRALTVLMPKEHATMLLLGANEIAPGVVLLDHFMLARPRPLAADKEPAKPTPAKSAARGRRRLRRQARKITEEERAAIDKAVAEGKVKLLKPGFGLPPSWLTSESDQ